MKTSILLVAAFTLVAGYSVYQSQQKEQMSDIALENVEALANDEIEPGDPCYNKSTYDANKPLAVQCGTPCKFEHLDINFWESTSYCH